MFEAVKALYHVAKVMPLLSKKCYCWRISQQNANRDMKKYDFWSWPGCNGQASFHPPTECTLTNMDNPSPSFSHRKRFSIQTGVSLKISEGQRSGYCSKKPNQAAGYAEGGVFHKKLQKQQAEQMWEFPWDWRVLCQIRADRASARSNEPQYKVDKKPSPMNSEWRSMKGEGTPRRLQ